LKFKKIGWNGLLFRVPEEVYLTRHGGDAKRGTLSLESEGYLIEIQWEPIPKKPKPIESIIESIIERARKNVKKAKQDLEIREGKNVTIHNHDAVYLHLKSIIEERYYIWYCKESDRIIFSRFVCTTFDKKSRNLIKQFLSSFKCHNKGKNVWSLMGIHFEIPQSFLLKAAEFKVGKTRIILEENKLSPFTVRTRTIIIEYFSMANLLFKDTYNDSEKWFEENYSKELKKILKKRRVQFKTIGKKELGSHRIIIKQAKTTSGFSTKSTNLYSTAIWHCPEMNRIYSVTVTSNITRPFLLKRELKKEEHEKIFNDLITTFKCH